MTDASIRVTDVFPLQPLAQEALGGLIVGEQAWLLQVCILRLHGAATAPESIRDLGDVLTCRDVSDEESLEDHPFLWNGHVFLPSYSLGDYRRIDPKSRR